MIPRKLECELDIYIYIQKNNFLIHYKTKVERERYVNKDTAILSFMDENASKREADIDKTSTPPQATYWTNKESRGKILITRRDIEK